MDKKLRDNNKTTNKFKTNKAMEMMMSDFFINFYI